MVAILILFLGLAAPLCLTVNLSGFSLVLVISHLFLCVSFALIIILQMINAPKMIQADPIWRETSDLLGQAISSVPILVRDSPWFSMGPILANLLVLLLAVALGSDHGQARRVLQVVAYSGACYSAYGIVAAIWAPDMLLWRERIGYEGDVIGTFPYRNTAATYFGCVDLIWLLMLCERIRRLMPSRRLVWKHVYKNVLTTARLDTGVSFGGFAVCLVALLMTGSRAGLILSVTAMSLAGALYFRNEMASSWAGRRAWFAAALAAAFLVLLTVVNGALKQRLLASGLSDEGRFDVYAATLRMIVDHPLLGVGLGAFPAVFPNYRAIPPDMVGRWLIAHSTPIELAAEMGIPFAVLTCAMIGAAAFMMLKSVLRHSRERLVSLVGAGTTSIAALHSCIDFPMQIPGFSVVIMALMGVGLAQAFEKPRGEASGF